MFYNPKNLLNRWTISHLYYYKLIYWLDIFFEVVLNKFHQENFNIILLGHLKTENT